MKPILVLLLAAIGLSSCTGNRVDNQSADSATVESSSTATTQDRQDLCFQKLSGTTNQDTAELNLVIEGDKVSGHFENRPFQKDARVGKIEAMKEDDIIKGNWIYMQEGVNDTLPVEFKLSKDNLIQKNYTVDPKTGREVFSEASVFNIEFNKISCN